MVSEPGALRPDQSGLFRKDLSTGPRGAPTQRFDVIRRTGSSSLMRRRCLAHVSEKAGVGNLRGGLDARPYFFAAIPGLASAAGEALGLTMEMNETPPTSHLLRAFASNSKTQKPDTSTLPAAFAVLDLFRDLGRLPLQASLDQEKPVETANIALSCWSFFPKCLA
jgi:hypothetical protein